MDFMEISKKRVTVRKFAQTPVENEKNTENSGGWTLVSHCVLLHLDRRILFSQ